MRFITYAAVLSLIGGLLFFALPAAAKQDRELQELMNKDIEELVVSVASKREESIYDAPGAVSVVTREEIRKYGALNLHDALRFVPSLLPMSSLVLRDQDLYIRGQRSLSGPETSVLFLLNGRPMRWNYTGSIPPMILKSFPMDMVERIEVIRGPGSVLYGTNAYSGVMNLVTRKPTKEEEASLSFRYGSFESMASEAVAGTKREDASIIAGVRSNNSNGDTFKLNDRFGNPGEISAFSDVAGSAAVLEYQRLKVNAFSGMGDEAVLSPASIFPGGKFHSRMSFVDLGYGWDLGKSWQMDTNVSYANTGGWYLDTTQGSFQDWLMEMTLRGDLSDRLHLLTGATANRWEGSELATNAEWNLWHHSVYGQLEYDLTSRLKVLAGGQMNKADGIDADFSPRAGIIARFNDQWSGKLLYGEAFRQPYPSELFINLGGGVQGNPDLNPQRIATSEAQVTYHQGSFEGSFGLFRSVQKNSISIDSATTRYANGSTIRSYGVEMEGKYRFSSEWEALASLMVQQNEQDGRADANLTPNELLKTGVVYMPVHYASLGLFNQFIGAGAQETFFLVNPGPDSANIMTANLHMDLNQWLQVSDYPESSFSLFVDNLLDEQYYTNGGGFSNTGPSYAGRAFFGTLSIRF